MRYLRSLLESNVIYGRRPLRLRRMSAFYSRFVRSGDLCFDLGSHLGTRAGVLAKLGCRVIAVEPHPYLARLLERRFRTDSNVVVEAKAVGPKPGSAVLYCSPRHLAVSSLDGGWVESLRRVRPHAIRFTERHVVESVTLTELTARYGVPAYCKLDLEGLDVDVIETLAYPLPIISFECLPPFLDTAIRGVRHLDGLQPYRFNFFERESHRFLLAADLPADPFVEALHEISRKARSYDIFAFAEPVSPA